MSQRQQPYRADYRTQQQAARRDDSSYPDEDTAVEDDTWEIPPVHNRQGVAAPVGFYVGQLESMKRETKTRFTDYLRIRFDFRVLAVISARDRVKAKEVEGQIISGWANLTMGPRSTMRAWSEALLDKQLDEDEQPGKADLLGRMCEISIVPHETEQGEATTKIGALTPYRPAELDQDQKPAARPAAKATAQEISGKPAAAPAARQRAGPPAGG